MAWRCLQPIATHSIADALEVQLEEPGADMVRMAYRPDVWQTDRQTDGRTDILPRHSPRYANTSRDTGGYSGCDN